MTHSERRASWQKETIFAAGAGLVYGTVNSIVGHPFDTVKTRMQIQQDVAL